MTDSTDGHIPDEIYGVAGDLLNRLQAGEPGIDARIAQWIARDSRHRAAYEFTSQFLSESAGLSQSALGPNGTLRPAPFYRRHSTHVAVAAMAAVALVSVTSIWLVDRDPLSRFSSAARAASFQTKQGEVRTFQLADGTRLTLDTDSGVAVDTHTSPVKIELVHGRVRAETDDGARSFKVRAGRAEFELEGASFDLAGASSGVRIVAVDAPLQITRMPQGRTMARFLGAGDESMIGDGDMSMPFIRSDTAWTSGMLKLEATPLADAVAAINRYNKVKILLSQPTLGTRKISGAYNARDPSAFSQAIARIFDLKVERSGSEIIFSEK